MLLVDVAVLLSLVVRPCCPCIVLFWLVETTMGLLPSAPNAAVHAAVIWLLVTQQAFDSVFLCVCADANDAAQFAELKTQGDLTRRAWERDVQVSLHYSHFECLNALNRRPQATKHLQTTAKHEYCRRSCICAWRVYRLST